MADDWIKMRHDLRDDPAMLRIIRETCLPRTHAWGCFFAVMEWADRHTVAGDVPGVTIADIDAIAEHDGYGAAMVAVGWIDATETGIVFVNFDRHNGTSAKRRASDNRRKSDSRRNVSAKCPQSVRSPADKVRTREEKKRVEETKEEPPLPPTGENDDEPESPIRVEVARLLAADAGAAAAHVTQVRVTEVVQAVTAAARAWPPDSGDYDAGRMVGAAFEVAAARGDKQRGARGIMGCARYVAAVIESNAKAGEYPERIEIKQTDWVDRERDDRNARRERIIEGAKKIMDKQAKEQA